MKNSKAKTGMKILLATDGSEYSKAAVEEIANRYFSPKTGVRIVSAYQKAGIALHMEPMGVLREYHTEIDRQALKSAKQATEQAAKILQTKNDNLTVTTVVIAGDAKDVILDEAEKFGADLIVVGSHGYGAVKRFLLGSVSQAVALNAKCSVEIVRKLNSNAKTKSNKKVKAKTK